MATQSLTDRAARKQVAAVAASQHMRQHMRRWAHMRLQVHVRWCAKLACLNASDKPSGRAVARRAAVAGRAGRGHASGAVEL